MPWNGSGVFTRIYNWVADANAGIDILPDRMDTDTTDIASGLEHCLTVNGETIPVSNLPMNNYHHTGASPGVVDSDYATVGQVKNGGGGIPGGGYVPIAGNVTMGPLNVNGTITAQGPGAALAFLDRTNSQEWLWYATNGGARLWLGGDKLVVDGAGNVTSAGNLYSDLGLIVAGNGSVAGSMSVSGGLTVAPDLHVTRNGQFDNFLTVLGGVQVNGNVNSASLSTNYIHDTGNMNVDGTLYTGGIVDSGAISTSSVATSYLIDYGNMDISGALFVGSNLNVAGSVGASGNLTVSNTTTLNGNTYVQFLQVSGELYVPYGGTNQMNGGLTVNGGMNVGGGIAVNGNFSVGGTTYFAGDVTAQNGLACNNLNANEGTCYGEFDVNGLLLARTNLIVVGNGQFDNLLSVNAVQPLGDNQGFVGQAGLSYNSMSAYAFLTVSDLRAKADIEALAPGCLDLVRAIQPKSYLVPSGPDPTARHWGFIAQEVAEAMAASGREFAGHVVGDDEAQTQGLVYSELLALLWGAVQELAAARS